MTPDQRLALVEYIAHLCTADWANITKDLQRLGFIPPEVEQDMLDEMSAPIGRILAQLSGGACCWVGWLRGDAASGAGKLCRPPGVQGLHGLGAPWCSLAQLSAASRPGGGPAAAAGA